MSIALQRSTIAHYVPWGVAASLVHMVMMIPGYSEDGDFDPVGWFVVLAVSIVLAVVIFSFVVPGGGAVTGAVLGAVALVSVVVFWAGLTLPLAAAAAVVGWHVRQRGEKPGLTNAALGLAAVSAIALVAIIIGDAVAN